MFFTSSSVLEQVGSIIIEIFKKQLLQTFLNLKDKLFLRKEKKWLVNLNNEKLVLNFELPKKLDIEKGWGGGSYETWMVDRQI